MNELLIKIRAMFEGKESFDQASSSIGGLRQRMTECVQSGSAFGSALGSLAATAAEGLIGMAEKGIESIKELALGFAEGSVHATEYAHQMHNLGEQIGQQVGDTTVLTQAFKNAGLGAEEGGRAINMLQKALSGVNEEGLPTKHVFDRLGLSIQDLKNMSATEALDTVAKRISSLGTAADKTGAVMEMFGRSGARLLPLLANANAIDTAREQVGGLAGSLQDGAEELSKFSSAWESLDLKKLQFFSAFADGLAGSFEKAGEAINKLDFTKFGQGSADLLTTLVADAEKLKELLAHTGKDESGNGVSLGEIAQETLGGSNRKSLFVV